MRDHDEAQLVISAAAGGEAAFTELVRRYRDRVYGYCYHRTGNFEDARDLAQETFVRAYTSLGQLRDASSFGPWVRRIAANICNRWAAKLRETPVEQIDVAQPRESPIVVLVREALDSLPEKERLAIVLHYVDGLSYSEIAGFLETSKAAVRGRLYRARDMLKTEVLKMTEEAFGANRLDEGFVIEAVNAAIQKAMNAYNMLGDKVQSRKEVDEAVALVEGDHIKDPIALAGALLSIGTREFVLGEGVRAREHWDRAKSLFERAGDRGGVEYWRFMVANEKMTTGDLAAAHGLFLQCADYWLAQSSDEQKTTGYGALCVARALESVGMETDPERIADFRAGWGQFEHQDGETICTGGPHVGFTKEGYPARLATRPGPPFGPTPLPLVLMMNRPAVGDTLRFVNQDGHAEESVLETLSETVTVPAGKFENCARSSSRVFASDTWEGEVIASRKLWFAPGVGIVRIVYESAGGPADTSELIDFHVMTLNNDYIPLSVGNWWKWRWIEAEEQYGFRAESYREIVSERGEHWAIMQYVFAVKA